jgi:hypothetical protein
MIILEPQPLVVVWTLWPPVQIVLCMVNGPIVVVSFDVIRHLLGRNLTFERLGYTFFIQHSRASAPVFLVFWVGRL